MRMEEVEAGGGRRWEEGRGLASTGDEEDQIGSEVKAAN